MNAWRKGRNLALHGYFSLAFLPVVFAFVPSFSPALQVEWVTGLGLPPSIHHGAGAFWAAIWYETCKLRRIICLHYTKVSQGLGALYLQKVFRCGLTTDWSAFGCKLINSLSTEEQAWSNDMSNLKGLMYDKLSGHLIWPKTRQREL